MTAAATLWRLAASAAAPALPLWLAARAARGKEFPARLAERRGRSPIPRPPGRLLWIHAASVGETQSILPVLPRLRTARPDLSVLLTTTTVTSARLIPARLGLAADPARSGAFPDAPWLIHQIAPLDVPAWVARFLDHWRPDAAAFVESELWPNLLGGVFARGIPAALVNARLSPRSAARWRRARSLAATLLGRFAIVLPQSTADASRLIELGALSLGPAGNLKFAAPPLPADEGELARLSALFGSAPVWVAASTHPGEEEQVLAAHTLARRAVPDLRLILAPRHPERGAEVAALARSLGFSATRRSLGEQPTAPIWILDTLGELGLAYRLGLGAFVGGSLVPKGGQNPLEPARLGLPVALGPHTEHFAEIVSGLLSAGAASLVRDPDTLSAWVGRLAGEPAWRQASGRAAAAFAAPHQRVLDRTVEALLRLVPRETEG
ncbi:MAG: 3-deoxy-D-manno-octulosonic acid transferase [Elioraea sp.]|nr:3-deoxy-D-manno-octulosonic acid transferase [Elioraea sp.]